MAKGINKRKEEKQRNKVQTYQEKIVRFRLER